MANLKQKNCVSCIRLDMRFGHFVSHRPVKTLNPVEVKKVKMHVNVARVQGIYQKNLVFL